MGLLWVARMSVPAVLVTLIPQIAVMWGAGEPLPASLSDALQIAALASLLVFGLALPFIVLPLTSGALAEREGDRLSAVTVLGQRHLGLGAGTRAVCLEITSWAHSWWVTAVSGSGRGGRLLFIDSEVWGDSIGDLIDEKPREVRLSALLGFVAVIVWACTATIPALIYVFLMVSAA